VSSPVPVAAMNLFVVGWNAIEEICMFALSIVVEAL